MIVIPQQWLTYADARISTSHDYDGEKSLETIELMSDFIGDSIKLYQTLSKKSWQ